jgi:hypothetical protein
MRRRRALQPRCEGSDVSEEPACGLVQVIEDLVGVLDGLLGAVVQHLQSDDEQDEEGHETGQEAELPAPRDQEDREDDQSEYPREVGDDDSRESFTQMTHFKYSFDYTACCGIRLCNAQA